MAEQKVTTKRWFKVYAPSYLNTVHIGDVLGKQKKDIHKKKITMNLGDVTNDARRQKTSVTFQVVSVDGNEAHSRVTNVAMTRTAVKRSVRKGRTKITDRHEIKTSDDNTMTVKPFIITNSRVKNSAATAVRKKAKKMLENVGSDNSAEDIYQMLLNGTLQRQMKEELADITPIRFADLKESKLHV